MLLQCLESLECLESSIVSLMVYEHTEKLSLRLYVYRSNSGNPFLPAQICPRDCIGKSASRLRVN